MVNWTRLWCRLKRWTRTAVCLALFGVTVIMAALAAPPVYAPENPWQLVAEVPIVRGPQAATAELLAEFLDRAGVRMPPERMFDIAEAVAKESDRHGIDPALLISVIMVESRFRTDAVSEKGAIGLMQLLPSTAVALADELNVPWGGDVHLLDPRLNIELGAHYLSRLLQDFHGDVSLALTAYNKGPGYVQNMLASGEMESTESGALSSYAEKVSGRMATTPRRRPRPSTDPSSL
jgi:soluble lytic murein transglycosylase-like protein